MLVDRLVDTPGGAVWPLAIVAVGAAVVWRQAESRESSRAAVIARVVAGASLVALGIVFFLVVYALGGFLVSVQAGLRRYSVFFEGVRPRTPCPLRF